MILEETALVNIWSLHPGGKNGQVGRQGGVAAWNGIDGTVPHWTDYSGSSAVLMILFFPNWLREALQ